MYIHKIATFLQPATAEFQLGPLPESRRRPPVDETFPSHWNKALPHLTPQRLPK